MKRYVYLLWDHEEWGPESIVVADSPKALLAAAERRGMTPQASEPRLSMLLAKPPEELATTGGPGSFPGSDNRHSLGGGWGGLNLQVIELASDENGGGQ